MGGSPSQVMISIFRWSGGQRGGQAAMGENLLSDNFTGKLCSVWPYRPFKSWIALVRPKKKKNPKKQTRSALLLSLVLPRPCYFNDYITIWHPWVLWHGPESPIIKMPELRVRKGAGWQGKRFHVAPDPRQLAVNGFAQHGNLNLIISLLAIWMIYLKRLKNVHACVFMENIECIC